jgi:CTP synthase
MINAAKYAMEERIPFLGICFGAQLFFISFCRNYLGLHNAHSTEINPDTPYPVIDLLETQKDVTEKGGTMRLGAIKTYLKKNTRLYEAYQEEIIEERYRHRYHIQSQYINEEAREKGLIISSTDETGKIVNSIELDRPDHFMVGTQFHPEFKSAPFQPSPVYSAFMQAVIKDKK